MTTRDDQAYPADTPLADMTVEQRLAYWRARARKWEGRSSANHKARIAAEAVAAELRRENRALIDRLARQGTTG